MLHSERRTRQSGLNPTIVYHSRPAGLLTYSRSTAGIAMQQLKKDVKDAKDAKGERRKTRRNAYSANFR